MLTYVNIGYFPLKSLWINIVKSVFKLKIKAKFRKCKFCISFDLDG